MLPEPERIHAWDVWLDECAPAVHLGDDFGREELAELLAAAVEIIVPGQPMAYSARERWWRAWLRVEGDPDLDLEVGADRARLAAQLARAGPAVPGKDTVGRWRVFGHR
jgi:hypothetical protein